MNSWTATKHTRGVWADERQKEGPHAEETDERGHRRGGQSRLHRALRELQPHPGVRDRNDRARLRRVREAPLRLHHGFVDRRLEMSAEMPGTRRLSYKFRI